MFKILASLIGNVSYTQEQVRARELQIELRAKENAERKIMLFRMNGKRFKCGPWRWQVRTVHQRGANGVVRNVRLEVKERNHGR